MRYDMENKNRLSFNGIGFVGLLTIVFITLKLLKIINWSWLWVLSPLWIDAILGILIIVIALVVLKIKKW